MSIFLLALLLRALGAAVVYSLNAERLLGGAFSYEFDAGVYDLLALNLWRHGAYSANFGPPYVPVMHRVPGYPSFLALVYSTFGHRPPLAIYWQLVLGAATCALVQRLGEKLTGNRRIATLAALILAFDPSSIVAAQELMPETVFTLLLLLNLAALWDYRLRRGRRDLLLAAAWLALAALVRSEAAAFAVVEAILLLVWAGRPPRRALATGALFLGVVWLVLAPWLVRNWYHFRVLALASVGTNILLFGNAMLVEAELTGLSRAAVRKAYRQRINEYRRRHGLTRRHHAATVALYRRLALTTIAEHPLHAAKLHFRASAGVWLPNVQGLAIMLGYPGLPYPQRWEVWRQQGWWGVWELFRKHLQRFIPWPVTALFVTWGIFLAVVYSAALRGYVVLARLRRPDILLLVVLPVLYFAGAALLAKLDKSPRYRVPVMPCLAVAAAIGMRSRPTDRTLEGAGCRCS